ncbi:hypothetical protein L227DRAFT_650816 [Lentinus tigrinus ALCF2SS1-6]|uniref:F-box domain-containing protein n=1 Tax=Lentinus tigrinus ALCF2SS1-6 TaxID=1328759 RepID=A0A5C2SJ14_9APHY|nr:hypothetical protein L227DRAFT_650816 [Lentinus tigrinus ALCF2SS1-6]
MDGISPNKDYKGSQLVGYRNPVFPAEIADMIIDYLHGHRNALKRCSLVCKGWKASSRHHLFRTVSFSPKKVAFSDIVEFLASSPDVCAYIKEVTLLEYQGISLRDLRAALHPLKSLRSVTLDRLHVSKPKWREPTLEPVVGVLDTLRIASSNVLDTDISVFFDLLGLFSELTALHLSYSHLLGHSTLRHSGLTTTASDRFRRVETLLLRALPLHALDVILHRNHLPHRWASLRTLCMDGGCSTWEHVKRIGEFIAVIGPQLRELAVRLQYMLLRERDDMNGVVTIRDTAEKWRALRLDKCTKLHVFKISVGHGDPMSQRDGKAIFRSTVDLLTHLPSNAMEVRVSFALRREWYTLHDNPFRHYRDGLMALDWKALDCTLSADRFEKLRVVLDVGVVRGTFNMKKCQDLFDCVRRALPELESRYMLKLDFTKEKWWGTLDGLWD